MGSWFQRRPPATPAPHSGTARHTAGHAHGDVRQDRTRTATGDLETLELILFRHDPVGVNFGDNPNEYAPEARTIAARRAQAHDVADVERITHEEFTRWFGPRMAIPQSSFGAIAEDIWALWSTSADATPPTQGR